MTTAEKIIELLTPGIGKLMATSSVKAQCANLGVPIDSIPSDKLPVLAKNLSTALVMFIGSDKAKEMESKILKCG